MPDARQKARHFIDHEQAFHLGALPTEQSHPKTRTFSQTIQRDTRSGIRMLQAVDDDIVPVVARVFAGEAFTRLTGALRRALGEGRRIYFSGCGATGRVSILLESAWRHCWQALRADCPAPVARLPALADSVRSVMTGGDYALVRSVESFEDYAAFGRHQMAQAGVAEGDVVVAITEGGETSSVIGTAWQGLEAGAEVFFVCNNPLDVLAAHVERSREIIDEPRITKLDLASGPMAIAGSTRMQATTAELLVVGAALELALAQHLHPLLTPAEPDEYRTRFVRLLADLAEEDAVGAMAGLVEFEADVYSGKGAVTYFADGYVLDIFTDTTERAPTFMLPPFRKCDDHVLPRSWAFVKNPLCPTPEAWLRVLGHPPRCLDWADATYERLGASDAIRRNPPRITASEIEKFLIGNEPDASRCSGPADAAVTVLVGSEAVELTAPGHPFLPAFGALAAPFPRKAALCVGPQPMPDGVADTVFHASCTLPRSPLRLWQHLAIKLVLNTVSTATMARLGRVDGNWMAHVETSNKKLIDRGTRLVAELCGLDYEAACYALHDTMDELAQRTPSGEERPSPVALTIQRLGRKDTLPER